MSNVQTSQCQCRIPIPDDVSTYPHIRIVPRHRHQHDDERLDQQLRDRHVRRPERDEHEGDAYPDHAEPGDRRHAVLVGLPGVEPAVLERGGRRGADLRERAARGAGGAWTSFSRRRAVGPLRAAVPCLVRGGGVEASGKGDRPWGRAAPPRQAAVARAPLARSTETETTFAGGAQGAGGAWVA